MRAGAQADAARAGCGLGDHVRVQLDRNHALAEVAVEFGLQLQLQRGGGDGDLLGRREQLAVELVGDVDEVPRCLARGGTVAGQRVVRTAVRSEEHTSELQSLMRISYAVFCLKKKKTQ